MSAMKSIVAVIVLAGASLCDAQAFVRGNVNGDGSVNIADAVGVLAYLFQGAPAPTCLKAADTNDSGAVDIADAAYLLNFLFASGPILPPPYPTAGLDPTPDALPCLGGAGSIQISEAQFEDEDSDLEDRLIIQGSCSTGQPVQLLDNVSGVEFAVVVPNPDQSWEYDVHNPPYTPCVVRAVSATLVAIRTIDQAPPDCGPPDEIPPRCTITLAPAIAAIGEPVSFAGVGVDPDGATIHYQWHFGGAVDATILGTALSGEEFGATTTFDLGGQAFRVTLTITDATGLRSVCRTSILVGTPPLADPTPVAEQPAPADPTTQSHVVLAFNDLGMHCADLSSQPFSILPPYNVLNAVVIERGVVPQLLDDSTVELVYSAASNPADVVLANPALEAPSINSTSVNAPVGAPADLADIRKTDFWDPFDMTTIVAHIFGGLNPPPDQGLPTVHNPGGVGRQMPGFGAPYSVNVPKPFSQFRIDRNWFTAEGIPITPTDDYGRMNAYPLMRVQARDKFTGALLAAIDATVPVSTEVDCRDCHVRDAVGADSAARPGVAFVTSLQPGNRIADEVAAKTNILRLHDHLHGSSLELDSPVLCAGCHNSYALEEATGGALAGDPFRSTMSAAMHGHHGKMKTDAVTGELLRDAAGNPLLSLTLGTGEARLFPVSLTDLDVSMESNCFKCHPGKTTQCFRDVMFGAGLRCNHCHGDMLATGSAVYGDFDGTGILRRRLPWRDEPRCESCHRGDAVNPGVSTMLGTVSFNPADVAAVALLAVQPRFAENPATLYRNSFGHGGAPCEACHGSPHAIWPVPDPLGNDNVTATQLQGHAGTVMECTVCHFENSFPNGTLDGPHGMHPVDDPKWIRRSGGTWHKHFAQDTSAGDRCAPCHGIDHRGTRLSVTPVDRELRDDNGELLAIVRAGQTISCDICHSLSDSFDD